MKHCPTIWQSRIKQKIVSKRRDFADYQPGYKNRDCANRNREYEIIFCLGNHNPVATKVNSSILNALKFDTLLRVNSRVERMFNFLHLGN